jgi:DNA-binding response OmpR family regulator
VRVLVVEDEEGIREVLRQYLMVEGHVVLEASDGHRGLALFREQAPDLVLLDLMLPGLDGFSLVSEFRRLRPSVPVIMLTARDSETDKIAGLRLGADDYVTKPFSPRELMARILAVSRRSASQAALAQARLQASAQAGGPVASAEQPPSASPAAHRAGAGLDLDVAGHRAFYYGLEIELTRSEFALTATLGRRPMRTFTRGELLERVRGDGTDVTERSVDVHIANLRRKLDEAVSAAGQTTINPVETVWGIGYRWREEVPARVRDS